MPRYEVDVKERIAELMYDSKITDEAEVTYSFFHGYEKLTVKRSDTHGSLHYAGSYHPNAFCEGSGVCKWCGRTL